jgi:hypothetical protein
MAVVVKIEMWPGGDPDKKYDLGHVIICNVGGTEEIGEYDVALFKSATYARKGGKWRTGKVRGFSRRRLGPYDLVLRALIAAIRDRSSEAVRELKITCPHCGGAFDRNLGDGEPSPLAAEVL